MLPKTQVPITIFLELRIALNFVRKVEKKNLESKLAFASNHYYQRSMFHMALPVC
jgi:hypothetical protein